MDESPVESARQERGLSQVALAQLVGISRQALHQIETARSVPGVDVALRIAQALGVSVEQLFASRHNTVWTEHHGAGPTARVSVAKIDDRLLSYALPAEQVQARADGLLVSSSDEQKRRAQVELLVSEADVEQHVVIQGCAPGLGLLADHYARHGRGRGIWRPSSNAEAMEALQNGWTHLAAIHGPVETGPSHAPCSPELRAVCLGHWQLGLISRKPVSARVRSIGELRRRGLRIAQRRAGARAQQLLESQLEAHGLPERLARQARHTVDSHLAMARCIASGQLDVGVASFDAALLYDLHFLPLVRERIDLYFKADALDTRLARMLQTLTQLPLRAELSSFGYETRDTGRELEPA